MAADFEYSFTGRTGTGDLLRLLERPDHPSRDRFFTALKWYNHANESQAGQDRSLLNLAVAFEALLNLPDNAKSERLADSISLILGRTDRIQDWATQFYAARSRVAHEGTATELYYRPNAKHKSKQNERFGSLMLSGRVIFQLCVATLLTGVVLSDAAQLSEKFVSNAERFTKICALLDTIEADPETKLVQISPIIQQIERHRFIEASPVEFDIMLGALGRSATVLLLCDPAPASSICDALRGCAQSTASDDLYSRLAAVKKLTDAFKEVELANLTTNERVLRSLGEEVWRTTFGAYFALERERTTSAEV